jgi:hypothetical protein
MSFYSPDNYMWSAGVNRCLSAGGHFGEIHWALKHLQPAAKVASQGDIAVWHAAGLKLSRQTAAVGEAAWDAGTGLPARADDRCDGRDQIARCAVSAFPSPCE